MLRRADGEPIGYDAYSCSEECAGAFNDEGVRMQRQMVASMKVVKAGDLGWLTPGFRDPNTGEALTLRQVYDRHATALCVLAELEARFSPIPLDAPR